LAGRARWAAGWALGGLAVENQGRGRLGLADLAGLLRLGGLSPFFFLKHFAVLFLLFCFKSIYK
jgi:hypothetical protein